MYYGPITVAQWMIIRRYVRHAIWWIGVTLGSVAIVYPLTIWTLWTLDLDLLATIVWFFELGSGMFATVGQWSVLRQWTQRSRIWLSAAAVVFIFMVMLSNMFSTVIPLTHAAYVALISWGLYQGIMSAILLDVLDIRPSILPIPRS
jgi:hypothetical protein